MNRAHAVVGALSIAATVATGVVTGASVASAADPVPQMYQDQAFGGGSQSPTADRPQSKLWFHDGSWWGLMRTNAADPDVTIHQLGADHIWRNTRTVVDARGSSGGDALVEGDKLYVASQIADTPSGGDIRVARLSYDRGAGTYVMDSGFPLSIASGSIESVTIARDSQQRLWVTFTRPDPADALSDQVWVAHSAPGDDTSWSAPFLVPVPDYTVAADDISAIVSFSGQIGVMWSDQQDQVVRFAVHPDTSADDANWTMETALSGTRAADDHLNVKSLAPDEQGRVYAAIKTSLGDVSTDPPSDPSIEVLTRSSAGTWTATPAATVAEKLTRPQLSLDETNHQLYVVMSTEGGGQVYYRRSPLGSQLSFTPKGVMLSWDNALINDATTAKAPITAASGLVVLASDTKSPGTSGLRRYYHAELAVGGGTPAADTTPPSVPAGLAAHADSGNQVTVSWTASTDAVGVASYQISRDGKVIAPALTSGTSFPDTTVVPSTQYSYTVSAVDAAGNRSAESAAVSVTTPAAADTTPPSVPAGLAAHADSGNQVTVSWTASTDAVGVASYQVSRGGKVIVPALTSGTSFPDTTVVPSTQYSYTVSAVDAAGNRSAESAAVSVTTPPATSGGTPNTGGRQAIQRYIKKVYNDLFHRDPDPAGLATWTNRLSTGTPYGEVANGITYSREFRSGLIANSYQHYLGRKPDPAGLKSWLDAMARGMHIEQMQAGFISSPEFYRAAGSDGRRWVAALYQTVLGRSPSAREVDSWTGVLRSGKSKNAVALGFLYSTEHLTTVVNGYYMNLLHRAIDPSGRQTWVTKIQQHHRDEEIIASIVSSAEYRKSV